MKHAKTAFILLFFSASILSSERIFVPQDHAQDFQNRRNQNARAILEEIQAVNENIEVFYERNCLLNISISETGQNQTSTDSGLGWVPDGGEGGRCRFHSLPENMRMVEVADEVRAEPVDEMIQE